MFSDDSTFRNANGLPGSIIGSSPDLFQCFQHMSTLHQIDMTKHYVLVIQVGCWTERYKELRTIRIGTTIGHGKHSRLIVFDNKRFVGKRRRIVNTASTRPITFGKVTTLCHESRNDPMKDTTLITERLGTLQQGDKVLNGLWHTVIVQFQIKCPKVTTSVFQC